MIDMRKLSPEARQERRRQVVKLRPRVRHFSPIFTRFQGV